jgi:adenylate kinase family enzyme
MRVSVVGCPGSGKTSFARTMAAATGAPHIELDSIHHMANWQPRPRAEIRAMVEPELDRDAWIVDGNYKDIVRDLVWSRADTIVWLDLPRLLTVSRVARRSLRRIATREALWNGNRERLRNLLMWDREENIVLCSWTRHPLYRAEYAAAQSDPQWSHVEFARLRTPRAVAKFLAETRRR